MRPLASAPRNPYSARMTIEKNYQPAEVESRIYQAWEAAQE